MALNAGAGTVRSRGDFNDTKNSLDFWGINVYGGWGTDNLRITADLGYTAGQHELRQTLPNSMGLGQLKADADTRVLSTGVRAEYKVKTDVADIVPHVGVRYSAVTADGFTAKLNNRDALKIEKDLQHVWAFPVGVTVHKEIQTDTGWTVTPRVDLSVVPATGDTKAKTHARVPGVAASDVISSRIVDKTTFDGVFGVETRKENISFGLNYGMQASEHRTGHGVTASFEYKF